MNSAKANFSESLQAAMALHREGKLLDAATFYDSLLDVKPNEARVWYLRGLIDYQQGRTNEALERFRKSISLNAVDSEPWYYLGRTMYSLRRYPDARKFFAEACLLKPTDATYFNALGNAEFQLKNTEVAKAFYITAYNLDPTYVDVLNNLGNVLHQTGASVRAEDFYKRAIEQDPKYKHAWNNLGVLYRDRNNFNEAVRCINEAIQIDSEFGEAYNNLGAIYRTLFYRELAEENFRKALRYAPNDTGAKKNLASLLRDNRKLEESQALYLDLLAQEPRPSNVYGDYLHAKMAVCDWESYGNAVGELLSEISAKKPCTPPFPILSMFDSPDHHLLATALYTRNKYRANTGISMATTRSAPRLRIGYFSADFQVHPVAQLIAGVFEHHDKSRFEVIAFSYGPDKVDGMRQRLLKSFDQFIEVREKSDEAVATMCHEMELDIAIDLSGYTFGARTGIFAQRCAPVQINYLGYPGTMGASFYDYIIADEVIIPPEYEQYYSEKVLRLPHCYQPNDRSRQVSDRAFTREELGLPKEGFVYCCFNNNYKILPETFDSWMRILKAVPGSVLWLLEDNPKASENLKKEAQSRGVDPGRLVFAPRMALPEHLARHKLADLFLDTFPYNAHTTASDALWVGLPILTRMGKSFASRVAASISKAAGLTELTTQTIQQYEALAIELANDPQRLNSIKSKLTQQLPTQPLYDVSRFTNALESLFTLIGKSNEQVIR